MPSPDASSYYNPQYELPAYIFIANQTCGTVAVIDPITNQIVKNIPMRSPSALAADPTLRKVYALSAAVCALAVIDGGRITAAIPLGGGAAGKPAVNPNNHMVFVPNSCGSVMVVNGYTNQALGAAIVGGSPAAAAVDDHTNLVYIANKTNAIPVLNSNTRQLYTTVDLPGGAPVRDLLCDPCCNRIYALRGDGTVAVINSGCNKPECAIAPPEGVFAFALDYSLGLLYLIDKTRRAVLIYDTCQLKALGTLPLPVCENSIFSAIAVNAATHLVYITDCGTGNVYIADGGVNSFVCGVCMGSCAGPAAAAVLACKAGCPRCGNCKGCNV